ncbi:MAG: glycosyltransferase [Fusicatenibacter sp.]|nr:glycosyltransferase [Lachnospiraceae bacterium]MDY2936704.1 glycosyltransferase [Fusicatenibacter sp.]
MKQEELISVVIPVYNIQEYVDDCIESVVHQTYQNLEIIIVDDGSIDQSGKKCDAWAGKDPRIQVIHQKNGGLSEARNTGMKYVSGNYVGFVDGDDVIFPEMYQKLLDNMRETSAQISCCELKRDTNFSLNQSLKTLDGYPIEDLEEQKKKRRVLSGRDAMQALVYENHFQVTVWNKLYHKSILDGISFEKGKYHEDEFWTYQVVARAERIVVLDEELYGYRLRENSITTQQYSLKHLDLLEARAKRLAFLEQNYPELIPEAKCNLRFECIRAYQFSTLSMPKEMAKIGRRKAYTVAKQHPISYADYKKLPVGRRVWCGLSRISFPMTCYIRNWLHYGP